MNSLRAIQSQFKFLTETLQDFGTMPIFKRTFSQDLDLLEQHLTKEIISQTDCKTTLTKLRTTFENAFQFQIKVRMQNYTRYDAQSFYDAMIFNMDSLGKYMLELILRQQRTPQLSEMVFTMPNDLPLLRVNTLGSDEGSMQHKELMELCTKLSKRLTSLEKEVKMTKQTYGAAYTTLITRGKKIAEIDQDEGITLVYVNVETQGRYDDDMEFDTSVFKEQEVFLAAKDVTTAEKEVISTASPTRTANVSVAETLVYIRRSTEKDKGKSIMQEYEQPRKIKKRVQDNRKTLQATQRGEAIKYKPPTIDEKKKIYSFRFQRKSILLCLMGTEVESEDIKREVKSSNKSPSKRQKDDLEINTKGDAVGLVKEKFNSTEPTDDKEREIWVELKRLFEPDTDDKEGNRHLHVGREGVSIVKGKSYIDTGRKALSGSR
ncbi:hypothetical protein Tco_1110948 [Tanacetum coccineum]|uniref:Uncharacterized protein n=1 Tax=Tanacetum coccineum TaxID=301880 RepID=A0ABQ5ILQ4_9ASTR